MYVYISHITKIGNNVRFSFWLTHFLVELYQLVLGYTIFKLNQIKNEQHLWISLVYKVAYGSRAMVS